MEVVRLGCDEPPPREGLIADPVNKAKSIWLTDDGLKRAEALFYKLFSKDEMTPDGA